MWSRLPTLRKDRREACSRLDARRLRDVLGSMQARSLHVRDVRRQARRIPWGRVRVLSYIALPHILNPTQIRRLANLAQEGPERASFP